MSSCATNVPPELVIVFSLYEHYAHPSLHSFPTRRSSDLDCGHCHVDPCGTDGGMLKPLLVDRACSDRKSTRLNSSHPSISYAVFCLKKKTSLQPKPSATTCATIVSDPWPISDGPV